MSDPKSVAAAQVAPSKDHEIEKSRTAQPKPMTEPSKPAETKAVPKV